MKWLCLLVLAAFACPARELDAARAERDPERRSERALEAAQRTLRASRDSYAAGEYKKALAGLKDIREAVDLARQSLIDSHKNPRKSKYYKRAELNLAALSRHLEEFKHDSSAEDQQPIQALIAHVNQIHDDVLTGILEKKK